MLKNVPIRGDFEFQKRSAATGEWEPVTLWPVPEGKTRWRLDFSCCEFSRSRKIPVHQAVYFLCSQKYKQDHEGWMKFKAETKKLGMTIDHLDAWWQVERGGLRRVPGTVNSSKRKCKEKPGTLFPRRTK